MKADNLIKQRFDELGQQLTSASAYKRKYKGERISFDGSDEDLVSYVVLRAEYVKWGIGVLNLLQRVFGKDSVHYIHFDRNYKVTLDTPFPDIDVENFNISQAIFQAAKEDFLGGYLFDTRGLIQAEVFDDVLEQAATLLAAGYKDPACVIAGTALETTLRELCKRNKIPDGKLERMNENLTKKGIYNLGMQKQITAWADRRNNAAHGHFDQYTSADIDDMIRGVNRVIAEYL